MASNHYFPKLHNAAWPGLVGKGPDSEPPIDLDRMIAIQAQAGQVLQSHAEVIIDFGVREPWREIGCPASVGREKVHGGAESDGFERSSDADIFRTG